MLFWYCDNNNDIQIINNFQTTTNFLKAATEHDIEVLTSESFAGDPKQQVQNLKVSITL